MERYDVGIWLNVLLIILECIALIQCLDALGCIDLTFYTIDSNIFLLISAVLYLISRKNIPYIVKSLGQRCSKNSKKTYYNFFWFANPRRLHGGEVQYLRRIVWKIH